MSTPISQRVADLDWSRITEQLHTHGFATTGSLLSAPECAAISGAYDQADLYRSRVVMARHGFGLGEYKYFNYPLPTLHQSLRECLTYFRWNWPICWRVATLRGNCALRLWC
jgi:hypothetical protein